VAIIVEAEFKFCIRDDNAAFEREAGSPLVNLDRDVVHLICEILSNEFDGV